MKKDKMVQERKLDRILHWDMANVRDWCGWNKVWTLNIIVNFEFICLSIIMQNNKICAGKKGEMWYLNNTHY